LLYRAERLELAMLAVYVILGRLVGVARDYSDSLTTRLT
jgi:hypothetical protein